MRMCLVHDLAEALIGDITPHCGVGEKEKQATELTAMQAISAAPAEKAGSEMLSLFQEYEANATPEAQLCKDLDKYDMLLQAFEYEKRDNTPCKLQEFFDSTARKYVFKHPRVVAWMGELRAQRDQFIEDKLKENKQ